MPKLSIGRIQRAARITSLIFGIVPILVFLGFTIHLLIAKYYGFPPHTLALLDIKMACILAEGKALASMDKIFAKEVAVSNLTPSFFWKRLKKGGAFAIGGAEAGNRNLGLEDNSSAPSVL